MYQTLTHGYAVMTPQTWMVPQQKYEVIHYVRETYLKPHNPSQYAKVDDAYLAALPKGKNRGPKASNIEPWVSMNYGPSLMATVEVGDQGNFAYKGIAVRLDNGPGGVSRGRHWMVFDHDTMRVAAAWSGEGFIDWNGINFDGQHQVHHAPSRGRRCSPTPSAPAGPIPRPAASTTHASKAGMANRTARCPAPGRSLRGCTTMETRSLFRTRLGQSRSWSRRPTN